jgi:hypothetical protein
MELPTGIIFKFIILMRFLIGCYRSLIVALVKLPLNCLYVHLHSIQEIRFMFHDFNADKLTSLAKLYPSDFDYDDLSDLNAGFSFI